MTRHIANTIEIDASPARVWATFTDTEAFPSWNPFITKLDGEPRPGARLSVRIQSAGGRASTFRPNVLTAEPERELRWLGRVLMPGLSTASAASGSNRSRPSELASRRPSASLGSSSPHSAKRSTAQRSGSSK